MIRKYYHLDSDGEDTNLQLFALRQARIYWQSLQEDHAKLGMDTPALVERSVFVLASLGLSISQLLGQNNPNPTDRVPSPTALFKSIVDAHGLDTGMIPAIARLTTLRSRSPGSATTSV
jgi:hypothetical protein